MIVSLSLRSFVAVSLLSVASISSTTAQTLPPRRIAPVLMFTDLPKLEVSGGSLGTVFLSGTVRHGWTGKVAADVSESHLFGAVKSGRPFQAGESVYGVPMSGGPGYRTEIVWCGLRHFAEHSVGHRWEASCVRSADKVSLYQFYDSPFLVNSLPIRYAIGLEQLEVSPQPADLPGPILATYSIEKFGSVIVNKGGVKTRYTTVVVLLKLFLDGEMVGTQSNYFIARDENGAKISIGGADFIVKKADDQTFMLVQDGVLGPNASAIPVDSSYLPDPRR